MLRHGDRSFRFDGLNAEPAFMDIFSIPQINGDVRRTFNDVQAIVLTGSAAIIKDVPANSSPPLRFEYLALFETN